jgi:DNA invertase Pin-like site-specific DNA recombinase
MQPHTGNYVAYYRVSTARQGASGLGLEAQQQAVRTYLNGGDWRLVGEYTEVESGKKTDRPQLERALAACGAYRAKLVIAKLDRLSRDAHFLLGLDKAGVDFVACDMPHANRLTVGIMALVAEEEGKAISARTKAALAQAKARGVKLGGFRGVAIGDEGRAASAASRAAAAKDRATDVLPIVEEIRASGVKSLGGIAKALSERGVPTARGGGRWTAEQVRRLLARR